MAKKCVSNKEPLVLVREEWPDDQWATLTLVLCGADVNPQSIEVIHSTVAKTTYYTTK